jgi:ring-1,2-phenylacetyl-CoA epoxidase subunit PaaA
VSTSTEPLIVKTPTEFNEQPAEYQDLVKKIIISHAINELTGAMLFDEPAIALAPTPYWKWLTCRIAMEEYGHHVRFSKMGQQIGVPEEKMVPGETAKKALSIFDFKPSTWVEFGVIKMLGDLAEILQVEDLLTCSYVPLQTAARETMPEEKFHSTFGTKSCTEVAETPAGRAELQDAIDRLFPTFPAFFGRPNSKNNALYRKWGIKAHTNEAMRADYMERCRVLVEEKLSLKLPHVELSSAER